MTTKTAITVAYGDGIGPEIMQATLDILNAANAQIAPEVIEIGEQVYKSGITSGISENAWESLYRTKVLLKAPITTPQGGGYKSLNVTLRKSLGLYANVRPCFSLAPFVPTLHPAMNLVIIRENEEDLYAGIEHRQTNDSYQCLKLITHHGCEKIIRYAFEYAKHYNRRTVTCMTKDNIMKMTDGVFHKVFDEVAKEYPDIKNNHYIIDIGTARLATRPEIFDVIVTENLYGDIISDVAAEVAGSVGLAGSANIGDKAAMFEAIHGSAPDIAGKKIANPSGLLNAAVQMLIHIRQPEVASLIQNAWLATLEDGIHTGDIYHAEISQKKVNTDEFAQAVIERLGKVPHHFKIANYSLKSCEEMQVSACKIVKPSVKQLVGVDVFFDLPMGDPEELGKTLSALDGKLKLQLITNRGLKVWPNSQPGLSYSDHWRCRFQVSANLEPATHADVLTVLQQVNELGLDFIKTEHLYTFDGERGFSLAQGQ